MTVIQYTRRDIYPQDLLEALELVTEICDCFLIKIHINRVAFPLKNPYDTIHLLAVR